uniref:Uncharacterized protein n=1 Tax=Anguilla anguilla TaxID=7936 RepID=A0A0E9TUA8_ANGAN
MVVYSQCQIGLQLF